jgi:hypothetical protein
MSLSLLIQELFKNCPGVYKDEGQSSYGPPHELGETAVGMWSSAPSPDMVPKFKKRFFLSPLLYHQSITDYKYT